MEQVIATREFDVLDRSLNIHQNYLLEASAGTGKTFSIENLVVRFLIEKNLERETIIEINQILVVTFTRAAARELKRRIYQKIQTSLHVVRTIFSGGEIDSSSPDYLKKLLEIDKKEVWNCKLALERALANFESCQILTIHSFCYRMLREHVFEGNFSFGGEGESVTVESLQIKAFSEFLRLSPVQQGLHPLQWKKLFRSFQNESEKLKRELFKGADRGFYIGFSKDISTLRSEIEEVLGSLSGRWKVTEGSFFADCIALAPSYKKTMNRSKEIFPKLIESFQFLESLLINPLSDSRFDQLLSDQLYSLQVFDKKNLKLKGKPIDPEKLNFPSLLRELQIELLPLITQALDPDAIFSTLLDQFQSTFSNQLKRNDLFGPSQILRKVEEACGEEPFLKGVRDSFEVVIIDEFQDTDPVQWNIFESLFLSDQKKWSGYLYLVGDPKQSIYSFRDADLYTYIHAKEKLGEECFATLNRNFRSQAPLIEGLNALFSGEDWISLPKTGGSIECPTVKAGRGIDQQFQDGKTAVHLMLHQSKRGRERSWPSIDCEALFIEWIGSEIDSLLREEKIDYSQCAVLVRDRFQAQRVQERLKGRGIPSVTHRQKSLLDSPALQAIGEMIRAVIDVRNKSAIAQALGGAIVGWSCQEIERFVEGDSLDQEKERVLSLFYQLRSTLFREGFTPFFQKLLRTQFFPEKTVEESFVQSEKGELFYNELIQVAALLSEQELIHKRSPFELLEILGDQELMQQLFSSLELQQDRSKRGVQILTIHMSKGLEFDLVFALGLINRSPKAGGVVISEKGGRRGLYPFSFLSEPERELYLREIDAEKMRQLYVALTRAKLRLYFPVLIEESGKGVAIGEGSPIEIFMERYGGSFVEGRLKEMESEGVLSLSWIEAVSEGERRGLFSATSSASLYPPLSPSLPSWQGEILSFSSLQGKREWIEGNCLIDQEEPPLHEGTGALHSLPRGTEFGVVVHQILQEIEFSSFRGNCSPSPLFDRFFSSTGAAREYLPWRESIEMMVVRALRLPLFSGESFCLEQLTPLQQLKEMEFFYPDVKQLDIEGRDLEKIFLKGFIDLFFEREGKFYILDWKTNWLGESDRSYRKKNLERAMREHHYFLQGSIYMEAALRYLKLFYPDQESLFGGVIYLFLRGVEGGAGVYHFLPTRAANKGGRI